VAIVEQLGGEIVRNPIILLQELNLEGVDKTNVTHAQTLNATRIGKEKYPVMALLRTSDRIRHSCLMDDLENNFTMGHTNYPYNITAAYNLITNYQSISSLSRSVVSTLGAKFLVIDIKNFYLNTPSDDLNIWSSTYCRSLRKQLISTI
jgi:hypothetical protein